jgi:hypothetical protein
VPAPIEQVFVRVLRLSPSNHYFTIVPSSSILPHEVCTSPDQTAPYHTLSTKLGASFLALGWSQSKSRLLYFG